MKNSLGILLGSTALLLGLSESAMAQTADEISSYTTFGPYVGLSGGGSFLDNVSPRHGDADVQAKFNDGFVGLGTIGYGFGDGFRLELEGGYRRNDVSGVRGDAGSHGGALGTWSVMGNALYDFDPAAFGFPGVPLVPHLGVGVGWARPRFDNAFSFNGNTVSGHDDLLAYQGIAGVDYALAPNIKMNLDYHFFGTQTGTFYVAPSGERTHSSLQDQEVLIGLKYALYTPPAAPQQAPPPPPPPMTPPPARPAPAPEAQRSFQVFFDFDKSDITSAAATVIERAADSVRQGNLTRITVTGHTDTVGSARYNQGLSERRAAAVKRQLISDGIGSGEITTIGAGKSGLLVPTADGVREPQNRRAEIILE